MFHIYLPTSCSFLQRRRYKVACLWNKNGDRPFLQMIFFFFFTNKITILSCASSWYKRCNVNYENKKDNIVTGESGKINEKLLWKRDKKEILTGMWNLGVTLRYCSIGPPRLRRSLRSVKNMSNIILSVTRKIIYCFYLFFFSKKRCEQENHLAKFLIEFAIFWISLWTTSKINVTYKVHVLF